MKYTLRPYQEAASKAAVDFLLGDTEGNGLVIAPTGCHAKGTGIVMADGTIKKVEAVRAGDFLLGVNNDKRRVVRLHRGRDTMFCITPSEGMPFIVNRGHILHLKNTETGKYMELPLGLYIRTTWQLRQSLLLHTLDGREMNFTFKSIGNDWYYGFELDGDHLYCDEQFFVHHNSGKSLIVADIADKLDANVLILQPSKEILEQNYNKMLTYRPDDCAIYSASFNKRNIGRFTFATIGSIRNKAELFEDFDYILIDEAHGVGNNGTYASFISSLGVKVVGFTATPFRLVSDVELNWKTKTVESSESRLEMLTSDPKGVFKHILYVIQVQELSAKGFLSRSRYFDLPPKRWELMKFFKNSSGSDYSDNSVRYAQEHTDYFGHLISIINRLLHPKSGIPRKGILVFTRFVEESERITQYIECSDYVSGKFTAKNRKAVLDAFREGRIKVLANANTLICGFDYPELDTVVLAAPTMSLSRYIQEVGRVLRPHPNKKEAWIVDLCGNIKRFGRSEDMVVKKNSEGKWQVFTGKGKQITDTVLE